MAKVGLKNLVFAELDTSDNSYGTVTSLGKAVSSSVSPSSADAKLFADDVLAESDSTFVSATVTLEVDDSRDATVLAPLLGHTVSTGEVVRNASDVAPYVGIGRVVPKIVNNVKVFKAEFLCKVKFKEPNQEESTKGDNVEFKTTSIEGEASALSTGVWSKGKEFTTEADALDYLDTCFGVV